MLLSGEYRIRTWMSESKGAVEISTMNEIHIRNAIDASIRKDIPGYRNKVVNLEEELMLRGKDVRSRIYDYHFIHKNVLNELLDRKFVVYKEKTGAFIVKYSEVLGKSKHYIIAKGITSEITTYAFGKGNFVFQLPDSYKHKKTRKRILVDSVGLSFIIVSFFKYMVTAKNYDYDTEKLIFD